MDGKMNFSSSPFLESQWKLRPVAHSWMFWAPSWRPSWGPMGKTKLYFLFMVIGHVVKHKCNFLCFKVKGKKVILNLPISFQEPEQHMFLFHGFCPWVSCAAENHLCGHGPLDLGSPHCVRHCVSTWEGEAWGRQCPHPELDYIILLEVWMHE